MNISISQSVKDQLRMKGSKTINVYTKLMTSCWSNQLEVFVKLKEPVVLEKYNHYEVDGIHVYLDKALKVTKDLVEIDLAKQGSDMADKDIQVLGVEV